MHHFRPLPMAAWVAMAFAMAHPTTTSAQTSSPAAPAAPTTSALDAHVVATPLVEAHRVDEAAGFTTTVTRAQIQQLGALDLASALRTTPGVQISRHNEVGSYSGDQGGNVYIRGLGASRPGSEIKTYLDGVPLYMGLWNHPLMDLLPLQGIESINVLKGPQLHRGGNQFGAIDLVSRGPARDGVHGEVRLSMGTMSTAVAQGTLLARQGDTDATVSMGHVQSDGDRPNADSDLTHAMGRVTHRLSPQWRLGGSFLVVRNEVGDPGDNRFAASSSGIGPYAFSNGVGRNDTEANLFTVFAEHDHGPWQGKVTAFTNQGHNNLVNDANWGTFDSEFQMSGLRWHEKVQPWAQGTVSLQLDHDRLSGHIRSQFVPRTAIAPVELTSLYAGYAHALPLPSGWTLTPSAGMRAYASDRLQDKASPQLGVVASRQGLSVYAQYAEGLLYPGTETYTLTRALPMAFATPSGADTLSPTRNRHGEVGVQWDVQTGTHVDLAVFHDRITDRYVWPGYFASVILNPGSGTWSNNFPAYTVQGAELSVRQSLPKGWTLFTALTSLHSSLSNLPYAPDIQVAVGLAGELGGTRVHLDVQHQSDTFSLTQDRGAFNPNPVHGFTVANVRLAWPIQALGTRGEVHLGVTNLTDTAYAYNAGYPMPGRQVQVGLRANF